MSAVLKDAGELLGEPDVRMSLNEIKTETKRQKSADEARREEYKDQKEKAKKDLDVKHVLEEQMQSAQDELVMLNEQNINLGQMLATATERCTQQKQQWKKNVADCGTGIEQTEDQKTVLHSLCRLKTNGTRSFYRQK